MLNSFRNIQNIVKYAICFLALSLFRQQLLFVFNAAQVKAYASPQTYGPPQGYGAAQGYGAPPSTYNQNNAYRNQQNIQTRGGPQPLGSEFPGQMQGNSQQQFRQMAAPRGPYQNSSIGLGYGQNMPNALAGNPYDPSGGRCSKDVKYTIFVPVEAVDKYEFLGYPQTKTNDLSEITVCCPGFGRLQLPKRDICVPACENCRNGRCIAPDQCECYDGFVKNDNGDCVFTCPLGCLNGRCYLDGTCQCDPGYKPDETRQFCRPICSGGCNEPLNCTEPEVCGCAKDYVLTGNGCQLECKPECGLGGLCQQGRCNCHSGYELISGVCQSKCYQKCENGICYSSNRCICNPGFVFHERTKNCIPQ